MFITSSQAVTIQLADNLAEFLHTAYNFLGFYKTQNGFLFLCKLFIFFSLLVVPGLQCTFKSPLVCHVYEF